MDIQIGNDVRVRFDLDVQYFNNYEILKCYFVNVPTVDSSVNSTNISTHRFPREPRYYYESTEYDLNCCGRPMYHIYPVNVINCHEYAYNGFGVNSKQFLDNRPRFLTSYLNRKFNHNYIYEGRYAIDSKYILAYFPAEVQLFTGNYQFIVEFVIGGVVRTINYGVIFKLVSEGGSQEGFVDVSNGGSNPEKGARGYIGFGTNTNIEDIEISSTTAFDNIYGAHTVQNTGSGNYLYVISEKPIEAVAVNGIMVDMGNPASYNHLYYYRSVDTFIETKMVVVVYEQDSVPEAIFDKQITLNNRSFETSGDSYLYETLNALTSGNISINIDGVESIQQFRVHESQVKQFYIDGDTIFFSVSPQSENFAMYGYVKDRTIEDNVDHRLTINSIWK